MVSDGLVLGFNRRTFFEIIGSVLQKRGDVVIREVHEQTLSVLGFHVMIVGQLEIAVNVSLHLLIFFGTSSNPHLHASVGILNASPTAKGLNNPLVAAAHTSCSKYVIVLPGNNYLKRMT